MDENGFKTTLYADGEANPNHELCMKMGREGIYECLPARHPFIWIYTMETFNVRIEI